MNSLALTWRLARRELRTGLSGFYVFLLCLILGIGTISGVKLLSSGMLESIRYDSKYILGGDIALRNIYTPPTKEQVKFLQKNLGPVTIVMETRAMARSEQDDRATMVELKAVDPFYPHYGSLEFADETGKKIDTQVQDLILPPPIQDGSIPDAWGAVVEKELLTRLGVHIGDKIRIGRKKFQIRGIITKEPDRIGSSHFTLAPRIMISRYVVDEAGLRDEGSQVYFDTRLYLPYVRTKEDLADAQKEIENAFPDATWKGRNFYNAIPRIEQTIDRLTLFLTLIGFSTLLVGGVGISNAVRSFLDGKISNIATLKCMGASQKLVFRVYMLQIFIIAALGIALGLFFGVGVSQIAGKLLTAKLSLSDKVGVYGSDLAVSALYGFLVTASFSLWPIGRAMRVRPADLFRDLVTPTHQRPPFDVTVMIAIATQALCLLALLTSPDTRLTLFFIGGALAAFSVFTLYAVVLKKIVRRWHVTSSPELRMAVANLHRPGNISNSVILSLGIGLTVLSAVALVEYNFSRMLKDDVSADAPSFFFIDVQQGQKDAFIKTMTAQEGARALRLAPTMRGRISLVNGVDAEKALVDKSEGWVIQSDRGFTYSAELPQHSNIVEGEWWPADYKGEPIVSIATDVAKAFDIGVGDKLTLNILGRDITAKVANVRDIDWASFTMNFAITFAPGTLEDVPATYVATVIVAPEQEEKMQAALARSFPNITSVRVRDALETAGTIMTAVLQGIRVSALITLVAGTFVLAGGIAAARRRHIYDAVILKVLGATRKRILKTFLLEYGILAFVTVIIASVLGTVASWGILKHVMDIRWAFSFKSVITVAALCFSITLTAGLVGTLRALRQKPAPHLRNQ